MGCTESSTQRPCLSKYPSLQTHSYPSGVEMQSSSQFPLFSEQRLVAIKKTIN